MDPIKENSFFKPLGRIDPSSKNSLFTPWRRRDSLSCLLEDLDINAWEMDDLMIEYEFNKSNRRGVLLVDGGFVSDSITLDTEDKIDAYVNEVLAESQWAMVKGRVGLAATVTPSIKRKGASPTLQSENVLRLKRDDGGSSPVLRMRNYPGASVKSPPSGGVKKGSRKKCKAKRSLKPGLKQQLITSSFSPRVDKKKAFH